MIGERRGRGVECEFARVLDECRRRNRLRFTLGLTVVALLAAALAGSGGFQLVRYAGAGHIFLQLLADSFPPDFTRAGSWIRPLLETIAMSVAATLLGAAAAVPLALLAARNTGFPSGVSATARLLLNGARSIPELVFGIIFVAAVGFGALAGVLALTCHSVGLLGKFVTEHFEHLDPTPAEALQSHGVSRAGIIRFCLLPQVLPRLVDVTLYRWEHNVRAASVMGMIGAGGLGLELVTAFSLFEYREAMALLIIVFAVVTLIDALSGRLRRSFVDFSG